LNQCAWEVLAKRCGARTVHRKKSLMQSKFSRELRDRGLSWCAPGGHRRVLMRHKIKRQRQIIGGATRVLIWPGACSGQCAQGEMADSAPLTRITTPRPIVCRWRARWNSHRGHVTKNNVLARAGTLIMPPIGVRPQ
jgi:hypothetical protein